MIQARTICMPNSGATPRFRAVNNLSAPVRTGNQSRALARGRECCADIAVGVRAAAHMAGPCGNARRTLGEQPAKLRARGALISPRDCEIFSPGKISMKLFWTATFCALLGGCASSTGILPAGPDTYTISEK